VQVLLWFPAANPIIPWQPRTSWQQRWSFAIEPCAKSTTPAPSDLVFGCDPPEQTMKHILDKAEVALEYPEKFYSGTFERSSRFEAAFDSIGVGLVLEHPGDPDVRKSVHLHINYGLLAEIVDQLAATAGRIPVNEPHREMLTERLATLHRAVKAK
jgi:hypothetical protein